MLSRSTARPVSFQEFVSFLAHVHFTSSLPEALETLNFCLKSIVKYPSSLVLFHQTCQLFLKKVKKILTKTYISNKATNVHLLQQVITNFQFIIAVH